jgi:ABC-type branched-subunit amino acid transport system permease subunit
LRAQFGGIGAGLVGIYLIVYGCALIVMVRWVPQGLVGWLDEYRRRRAVARMTP